MLMKHIEKEVMLTYSFLIFIFLKYLLVKFTCLVKTVSTLKNFHKQLHKLLE